MTTAAKKGNNFLLKIADKYDGSNYTTVAAMRTTSMDINKSSVDITSKDSNGWRELLPGGGIKSVDISAEGVYSGDTTQRRLLDGIIGKIAATGTVVFGVNPSNNDDFVFNGVTWTFVTAGATGNQTNIQGDLNGTLGQLNIDMNASVVAGLTVATYSDDSVDTFTVTFDTIGIAGNAYTLADGIQGGANATPSAATLTGGQNQNKHWNYQLVDEVGDTWTGAFHVSTYSVNGDANVEESFSITLNSADEIIYVAA